jgi:serine/threonine-protein kinase
MAPEMPLGRTVDERFDIYALGCVAYYLLTGLLVFDADTPTQFIVEHIKTEPEPPSRRSEMQIPEALEGVVGLLAEGPRAAVPVDAGAPQATRGRRDRAAMDRGSGEAVVAGTPWHRVGS